MDNSHLNPDFLKRGFPLRDTDKVACRTVLGRQKKRVICGVGLSRPFISSGSLTHPWNPHFCSANWWSADDLKDYPDWMQARNINIYSHGFCFIWLCTPTKQFIFVWQKLSNGAPQIPKSAKCNISGAHIWYAHYTKVVIIKLQPEMHLTWPRQSPSVGDRVMCAQ